MRFQPGEGPSRGLLRDYEIFGNIRITFVSSCSNTSLVLLTAGLGQVRRLQRAGPGRGGGGRPRQPGLRRADELQGRGRGDIVTSCQ